MNVFDIIGPVMIGPSSSHTAGACRIGRVARHILDDVPAAARISLCGSFAETGRGHGTDRALAAGILDMNSDDDRLPHSLELAEKAGVAIRFDTMDLPGAHPNTAVVRLTGRRGGTCSVRAASVGGGNIRVDEVNGLPVSFTGQYNTLIILHTDEAGAIANVSGYIAGQGVNIATFACTREVKGGDSIMTVEIDGVLTDGQLAHMRTLPAIHNVIQVKRI